MDRLPVEIVAIICTLLEERGGDMRLLMLVCKTLRDAVLPLWASTIRKNRETLKVLHEWQDRCPGKIMAFGWPCLWQLESMPAYMLISPLQVFFLGAPEEAVPHPTIAGQLMETPTEDNQSIIQVVRLDNGHVICFQRRYKQVTTINEVLSTCYFTSLSVGYTCKNKFFYFERSKTAPASREYGRVLIISDTTHKVIKTLRRAGIGQWIPTSLLEEKQFYAAPTHTRFEYPGVLKWLPEL